LPNFHYKRYQYVVVELYNPAFIVVVGAVIIHANEVFSQQNKAQNNCLLDKTILAQQNYIITHGERTKLAKNKNLCLNYNN
jgi:hypothetical protein